MHSFVRFSYSIILQSTSFFFFKREKKKKFPKRALPRQICVYFDGQSNPSNSLLTCKERKLCLIGWLIEIEQH